MASITERAQNLYYMLNFHRINYPTRNIYAQLIVKRKDVNQFTKDDIDEMIRINQKINEVIKESHGFRLHIFEKILHDMREHNEVNERERIVNQATELIAGFHYEQPFNNSNKRTGFVTLLKFLERNGYRLKDNATDELIELGKRWNISWEDDKPQVYSEFRGFLDKYIEPKV